MHPHYRAEKQDSKKARKTPIPLLWHFDCNAAPARCHYRVNELLHPWSP